MADLQAQARTRVARQYRNATKFLQWIDVLPDIAQEEIEDVLARIADVGDIDNASGSILDALGRIVGQPREYRLAIDNNTVRWGQDEVQFGASGSYFTATSESIEQDAEDDLYRILIKARIGRNTGDATINGVLRAVKFFVNIEDVDLIDYENMTFDIVFNEAPSDAARFVLLNFDILPRPQGVKFNGFVELVSKTQWGEPASVFGGDGEQFGSTYYS